jgi:hypothetical protein
MEKVNGKRMEIQQIAIVMRENMYQIKRLVMEFLFGKVEIFTREIIKTMREMALEKCTGLMVQYTKACGNKEFNTDKGK